MFEPTHPCANNNSAYNCDTQTNYKCRQPRRPNRGESMNCAQQKKSAPVRGQHGAHNDANCRDLQRSKFFPDLESCQFDFSPDNFRDVIDDVSKDVAEGTPVGWRIVSVCSCFHRIRPFLYRRITRPTRNPTTAAETSAWTGCFLHRLMTSLPISPNVCSRR